MVPVLNFSGSDFPKRFFYPDPELSKSSGSLMYLLFFYTNSLKDLSTAFYKIILTNVAEPQAKFSGSVGTTGTFSSEFYD
jgi:hypothetical protein